MTDFEKAKDKIMMGAEKRSMVMSEQQKKLTAYHESGHAIVGLSTPGHDPVYKVSIIPRGRALGVTMFVPDEDRYNYTRQYLESQLAGLFGGRVAEEMIFGGDHVTTGASNDIEKATEIARNMVTKWGLSDRLGPLTYSENDSQPFMGRGVSQSREISDTTATAIDEEVKRIIDDSYQRAQKILQDKKDRLHLMAEALVKYETIDNTQIQDIMNGNPAQPPEGWNDNNRSQNAFSNESTDQQSNGHGVSDNES
jgi:cell division protease FtsH